MGFFKSKPVYTEEGIKLKASLTKYNDKGLADGSYETLKNASHVNGDFYHAAAILIKNTTSEAKNTQKELLSGMQARGHATNMTLSWDK